MKTLWYLAEIYRIPTSWHNTEMVAIEAASEEEAVTRLRKIYGNTHACTNGYGLGSEKLIGYPPNADEILMARKHPLPQ